MTMDTEKIIFVVGCDAKDLRITEKILEEQYMVIAISSAVGMACLRLLKWLLLT